MFIHFLSNGCHAKLVQNSYLRDIFQNGIAQSGFLQSGHQKHVYFFCNFTVSIFCTAVHAKHNLVGVLLFAFILAGIHCIKCLSFSL